MLNGSVNIKKHIKSDLLNTCLNTENAKLRKRKHYKQLRELTLHQLQMYTIIFKPKNTFNRILLVIHLVMSATCDKLWYMNDLKKAKEERMSVLAPEFPDMDVAQFKACVTCTATLGGDQVPSLSSSNGFMYPPYPMQSYWLPDLEFINMCFGCITLYRGYL
jgi:hypothetical protein